MNKLYLSAESMQADAVELARRVIERGLRPSFVLGLWRGGAGLAAGVSEALIWAGRLVRHDCVRTELYLAPGETAAEVQIGALDGLAARLQPTDQLLLVDDVWDSGRSITALRSALTQTLAQAGQEPLPMHTAVAWFKPARNLTDQSPDLYLHTTDDWLVFPHELAGLEFEDIAAHKPKLAEPLQALRRAMADDEKR